MRCIECEEIELARVSDARPTQMMPVPYAALDGFPAGRSPRDLTRRRLLQWGVAGMASVYGAKELGWETIWESVAAAADDAAEEKALVLLYLAGGNDGLNVLVPNDATDYASYVAARPVIHRRQGDADGDRVGSKPLPGPGRRGARRSPTSSSPAPAAATTATRCTASTSSTATATGGDGVRPRGHAGGRRQAIQPQPLRQLGHLVQGLQRPERQDRLARALDRPQRQHTNPLQAISIDTALSKAIRTETNPVCAIPSLPMAGFTHNSSNIGGANGLDLNPTVRGLAGVGAGAGQRLPRPIARRRTASPWTTWENKTAGSPTVRLRRTRPGQLGTKLRTAAHLLRGEPRHAGHHDPLGRVRHAHRPARVAGPAADRVLARAGCVQGRPRPRSGIEQRVATLVFSEFGRRVRENGAGNEAGTDHGAGGLMFAMGSAVLGGFASDWPGCEITERTPANENQGNLRVPTDYRSVYYSVLAEWLDEQNPQSLLGGPTIEPLVRGDGCASAKRLFK